jgi:hypothetical protein
MLMQLQPLMPIGEAGGGHVVFDSDVDASDVDSDSHTQD